MAFVAFSCENDLGIEPSVETFLPKIALKGAPSVQLPCGSSSYTDPGVDATENGAPANVTITTTGRYTEGTSISLPDVYDISYVAINKDGIPGAVVRTVTIPPCNGDLVNSIEGTYTSTIVRTSAAGAVLTAPQYTNMKFVYIRKSGANEYVISDALAGWYEFGRSLGPTYAAPGHKITATNIAANQFTFGPAVEVRSFGGDAQIVSFEVNPDTKQIKIKTDWTSGFTFAITLTQVN